MLPYGLTHQHITDSVAQIETYFVKINEAATHGRLPLLGSVLAPSALSGLVSELMVSTLSSVCPSLTSNSRTGGFPDLVPTNLYEGDGILRGDHGIEVKASKNSAWQGHNIEEGWFLAIAYEQLPNFDIRLSEVYLALLCKEDWTFCPRKENSRRTPTASINKSGLKKLRSSLVYKHGDKNGLERRLEQAGEDEVDSSQDTGSSYLVG